MSERRSRTFTLGRLWASSQEDARTHARTPEERATTCFREHAAHIIRSLTHVFPGRDVEDAVQEAFFRLHTALVNGEDIEHPRAWVFKVARRELLTLVRRSKSQDSYQHDIELIVARDMSSSAGLTPEQVFLDGVQREAFEEALLSLSELERQCIRERLEGRTLAEVGAIVNLDLRRVSEIVARAIQRIREKVRG